tara:strand:- start:1773 stop:2018 length:246 start_codon:yes stop_codon:yes gene_type:complete
MANYAHTTLGITQTTLVDAVDDSKIFQIQALSPTVNASNLIVSIKNATAAIFGIDKSTRHGFLTGRRPVTGQLFPRGVYNK